MRKVVVQMQVTLDGFIGTTDGRVDWAFPAFDAEFTEWGVAALWEAGVHVMGAQTGRGLAEYWPSPAIHERDRPFAPPMNQIPKVVFSQSIESLDWNATTIARGDLHEEIARLKDVPDGKQVMVHGGARFVQSLAAAGLVDEYHLMVHPVVLGEGFSLFPKFEEPLRLELIEVRRFRSGAVLHMSKPAGM